MIVYIGRYRSNYRLCNYKSIQFNTKVIGLLTVFIYSVILYINSIFIMKVLVFPDQKSL
jgi:hypothetical protein